MNRYQDDCGMSEGTQTAKSMFVGQKLGAFAADAQIERQTAFHTLADAAKFVSEAYHAVSGLADEIVGPQPEEKTGGGTPIRGNGGIVGQVEGAAYDIRERANLILMEVNRIRSRLP